TGGIPNLYGIAELDASIMVGKTWQGAGVTNLVGIKNPISVARKILQFSPHVFMAGEGALLFAKALGFQPCNTVTDKAREKWSALRKELLKTTMAISSGTDNEDVLKLDSDMGSLTGGIRILTDAGLLKADSTVGVLALDRDGPVAGTSTSGWALRLPGRVSDSSVLGAGTYATPHAASSATGMGEYAIKHNLTRTVCDYIQEGFSPQEACEESIKLMLKREMTLVRIAVIALDANGNVGGATTMDSFVYCYRRLSDYKLTEVTPTRLGLNDI
ncbi:MAG: isoaspartyl peptidase/L-asparaginase, partial [Nitrososphaerota archaeon]|nr:isoaspartyl peptidase/L-asparaginase [Nitrososphaerota archaeon]